MKKKIILILFILIGSSCLADDLADALYAYDHGHYQQSLSLFTKACNQGKASGCGVAANQYAEGKGVTQDYFKSLVLYTKACDGGISGGCNLAARQYGKGRGAKQDYSKAKYFFGKECDLGVQEGCDNYRKLNENGF